MSEAVWKNAKFYAGAYDFSGSMNALALDFSADAPESTAMGAVAKQRLPGLKDVGYSLNGYFDAINPDKFYFDNMSLGDIPITMAETGAVGGPCFMFQPILSAYSPGGKVGDVMAFSVKGNGNGALVKGTILFPKTTKTASDTGTIMELGAVTDSLIGLYEINDDGEDYSVGDVLTVVQAGGSGGTLEVTKVGAGGEVQGVALLTRGVGYTAEAALATTVLPDVGTGCKITILSLHAAAHLYGLLHVFAASAGDTLDVIIQSDAAVGFASPTTVLTFTQIAGAAGYEYKTADAPITDTFYRVSFTIAGTDESFTFAVSMGIL